MDNKNVEVKVSGCTAQEKSIAVCAKVFRFLPDIRSGKQMFFTRPTDKLPQNIEIIYLKLQIEVFYVLHVYKTFTIQSDTILKFSRPKPIFTWICLTDWQPSETLP